MRHYPLASFGGSRRLFILLEEWYRNRRWTDHPEAVGTAGRGLVWDAAEWDHWYQERQNTAGLVTRADLEERHGLARSTLERLWALTGPNKAVVRGGG
ncbi:hypothetical protein SO3561_09828 [Streptomyces olivochromogenes]|uniref:Uncharacterized protein n=1 Tax=Streptomyces olivochromogenes TaxID=1963 RepID=A0A250VVL2_STROL|nr:hypothetical protein SO3561_09828 [Streptomyces olivochromogenes]